MTTRRAFVAAAIGALTLPAPVFAQPASDRPLRLGFLGTGSATGMAPWVDAFRDGLRELGYIEGKNLSIEYRWADGNYAKAPALAAELVRMKVDVLVTHGTPGTRAAKEATTTIPIVMATAGDAVLVGLVKSIAQPGGNVTGSTFFNPEIAAKRLELIKQALPRASRVGALINSDNPAMGPVLQAMEPTARKLNLELQRFGVRRADELEAAFSAMSEARIDAAVIVEDGLLNAHTQAIAALAAAKRLPIIGLPELAEAGGMMAYGVSFPEMYRRAAVFVDKIVKGTKPGDLPIERPTRFELIVNSAAAKRLGVTLPSTLLLRADRMIEQ
jgi:putative ABC transport system substrate-binding protein